MSLLPNTVRVLVDTREKRPLPIPASLKVLCPSSLPTDRACRTILVSRIDVALETGDYMLDGHPSCIIERKGHLAEVAMNCLTREPRRRFVAELRRLQSSCARPWILLEGSPVDLVTPTPTLPDPWNASDALQRLCLEYGIGLAVLPTTTPLQRRAAGEWAVRILVNGSVVPPRGSLPTPVPEPPPPAAHDEPRSDP